MPFIQQYMALDTLSNVLLSDIHTENICYYYYYYIKNSSSLIHSIHVYMCANIYIFHHFLFL